MVTLSKRYRKAVELADPEETHPLDKAVELLFQMPAAKFDETVELAVNLGVDPKQSTQMVRGTVSLPHGSGIKVVVAAFTENPDVATEAGAEHVGLDDLLRKVQDGWCDFDVAVATPEAMKKVRTVARILGPRGLMPNPKSGTVADDLAAVIKAVKAGRVEFKIDKTSNISIPVGKRSFTSENIVENIQAAIGVLAQARPEDFKGKYIKSMSICLSMSPSVKLEPSIYSQL